MDKKNVEYRRMENIIVLCLIALGIVIGTVIHFIGDTGLSSVFFSVSLVSILYKFLGGADDENRFTWGAIKFGGSAATLIGFIFMLKVVIFKKDDIVIHNEWKEDKHNWVPVSIKTGKVINVKFTSGDSTAHESYPKDGYRDEYVTLRSKDDYKLTYSVNGIGLENKTTETKGLIQWKDCDFINQMGLYNKTDIRNEIGIQIFRIYPYVDSLNSSQKIGINAPFNIQLSNSYFTIIDTLSGKNLLDDKYVIKGKQGYSIKTPKDGNYLVITEQANYSSDDKKSYFSKWIILKLKHSFVIPTN